ncbi:MAG: hypothetical protein MJZ41_07570 [Bacteroidaceae bacterium]|nr:hypothetical protein [Bacteroidaceae bacterium]
MAELTIQNALKAQVQYPLPADFFTATLMKRGLNGDDECTKEVLDSPQFTGAHADCLKQVIIYPNSISQGGISISKTDRSSLINIANRLYQSIGEEGIDERPKITFY